MLPDTGDAVIDFVATGSAATTRLVGWLRLGASKYYDWKQRYGKANEHNGPRARRARGSCSRWSRMNPGIPTSRT